MPYGSILRFLGQWLGYLTLGHNSPVNTALAPVSPFNFKFSIVLILFKSFDGLMVRAFNAVSPSMGYVYQEVSGNDAVIYQQV